MKFHDLITIIFFFLLIGQSGKLFAQAQESDDKVTLERAEFLEKVPNQPNVKKLIRRVIVRHKASIFYCDSAYLHEEKQAVDAFGNTRLNGEDGTTLTADSMYYDGNTQTARAIGKVVLNDVKMTLKTKQLDYDMANGLAHYYAGGKIEDNEKTLTSDNGTYDTNSKVFYFRRNVELISKQNQQKINTEDMTYNTISKMVYFKGRTRVESKDGIVYTTEGDFNTETQVSHFRGRTKLEDEKYFLEGDSLYFDNQYKIGFAQGNVLMKAKADSILVEGDWGWFRGKDGESKIYGNVVARNIAEGDTLYLKCDTLYSIDNKEKNIRRFSAYPNTKIFKTEFQGICDSLVFNRADSTISLFQDPVLWNKGNQMTADTLKIQLENNRIRQLFLRTNSYLISEDTLKNYNQLKGKNMVAFFTKNELRYMEVRGNSQNIFFAMDEKSKQLIGMNRIECSDVNIRFKENNKLHRISYLNKPEATFVPPHEIEEPQKKFKNFRWRVEEAPQRKDMTRQLILAKELNSVNK
jgi:lipopolysaccharide export system protein LptA